MANTKSSKKDLRRIAKRRVRNLQAKTALKTYVKRVRQAAALGDTAAANDALTTAVKMLDKASQKGIIHKNAAARRKSRAAKAAHKVHAVAAAPVEVAAAKVAKAVGKGNAAKSKAAPKTTAKAAPKVATPKAAAPKAAAPKAAAPKATAKKAAK